MQLRVEIFLAAVCGALAALTAIVPDWIEAVWGVDPDGGNGVLEWLIVAAFGIVATASALLARREWLRIRTARQ